MFVSDGGIEVADLEDILAQGPSSEVNPEECFADTEVTRQRTALQMLSDQVEMYREVGNHIDALIGLADNLADAAEEMRLAPVRLAVGAYPDDISQVESDISESVFALEATVRAYANVLASKYGIDLA